MKHSLSICLFIFLTAIVSSCNTTSSNSYEIQRGVLGLLEWGGSPAVDGTGMTLLTTVAEYGVQGTLEDYEEFFAEGVYRAFVVADIRLTGETTIRGWGVSYPEIEILKIRLQN